MVCELKNNEVKPRSCIINFFCKLSIPSEVRVYIFDRLSFGFILQTISSLSISSLILFASVGSESPVSRKSCLFVFFVHLAILKYVFHFPLLPISEFDPFFLSALEFTPSIIKLLNKP